MEILGFGGLVLFGRYYIISTERAFYGKSRNNSILKEHSDILRSAEKKKKNKSDGRVMETANHIKETVYCSHLINKTI